MAAMAEGNGSGIERILEQGILAILRVKEAKDLPYLVDALLSGGIRTMEISLNTPNALELLKKIKQDYGKDIKLGIGTVTSVKDAHASLESGAEFLVSPIYDKKIIATTKKQGVPVFSGAFSPTEAFRARRQGADVIKVFPADILGINYLKSLKVPFPDLPLMPSGGVNMDNIHLWFKAGAATVAVASALYNNRHIQDKEYDKISYNARLMADKASDALIEKKSNNVSI